MVHECELPERALQSCGPNVSDTGNGFSSVTEQGSDTRVLPPCLRKRPRQATAQLGLKLASAIKDDKDVSVNTRRAEENLILYWMWGDTQ